MNIKNLTRVFCLTLGILLSPSYLQAKNELEPKRTVIAGVVNNFSDESSAIIINYCDPLSDERRFAQNLIESNGFFQTEHEYVFAQNITVNHNGFINFFVRPGDSVFISINKNNVTFSGDNAELNTELFRWTNYSSRSFNRNLPQFDNNASPEELLASVKREFDKAQDSIKAYSERTNMSDFLKQWAYIDHKFMIANFLLDYNNPEANKWDVFTNPIFDVFNENNFQTMYFVFHLSTCMNELIKSEIEISRLFSEKEYVPAIQLTIEKLSEKAPEGTVRDVMLFNFLKETIKEMPELYDSIPEIKTAFSHDFFSMELEKVAEMQKVEQTQKLPGTEKQLDGIFYLANEKPEKLPKVKFLDYLTEKYKGKVLYIDVWATWCGPCMEEFKSTPALHNYFKGKDVVFVNLCLLSTTIERCKSAIMKHNISGENYFLDDNASKLFQGENNLIGFPSYLIVDKKGGVLYPAPRPSNLESAVKKIESCLKGY